ncbi:unnamed protein product [Cyclocybe aegerita]|uniref:Pyridoxamine 5'-phosphate oxidase N-terminal domain-containing protein n=1 Tax=Cyclocybe aegerita TaxID=1973307 RepID=A0A8S0VYL4_CYCAE|nr:unnamed protein product [Cyclocybe aegerita]
MGKFYDEIPDFLIAWIRQQKMFWVATAPLSRTGHVNVSPKGYDDTFHIANESQVWYEDLTGSGVESISHLQENGRMTILFCAFEGPPRIVRLFGTGTVHEFDTPEYNDLIPVEKRRTGSRSVIVVDVHKVGTSCGFSIPFYTYKADRVFFNKVACMMESVDIKAESEVVIPARRTHATALPSCDQQPPCQATDELPVTDKGLKGFWVKHNKESIDGLPGLVTSFLSRRTFLPVAKDWGEDDLSISTGAKAKIQVKVAKTQATGIAKFVDTKLLLGFTLGVVASGLWANILRDVFRPKLP